MIRPEIIRRRLEKLDEYLAILRQLQRYSYDEFAANPERYGSAERFLSAVRFTRALWSGLHLHTSTPPHLHTSLSGAPP